jgi:hypothetical protein
VRARTGRRPGARLPARHRAPPGAPLLCQSVLPRPPSLLHPSTLPPRKPLPRDASKVKLLERLLGSYEATLRSSGKLPPPLEAEPNAAASAPAAASVSGAGEGEGNGNGNGNGNGAVAAGDEPAAAGSSGRHGSHGGGLPLRPIELSEAQRRADEQERDMLTWVLHARAQHAACLGDTTGALAISDEVLGRSPDIVELHSARAEILGAAGDVEGARALGGSVDGRGVWTGPSRRLLKAGSLLFLPARPAPADWPTLRAALASQPPGAVHWAEGARQRDPSDRYLNSLAAEALFRWGPGPAGGPGFGRTAWCPVAN